MALTEHERQVLLAELDALQQRAGQVIERVARRSSIHLARPV